MMGIRDRGPPEPPPDPDGGRLGGPPAAQGLPDRRRAGALLGGGVAVAIAPETRRADLRGHAHPVADPDACSHVPDELPRDSSDILDGQLRAEPPVHARRAPARRRAGRRGRRRPARRSSATCTPASRRHGAEDLVEGDHRTRRGWTTSPSRRTSSRSSLAIEKLLGIEVPPKATWMRTLLLRAEPDPLAPRLARHRARSSSGRSRLFWYCFRERDRRARPLRAGRRRADAHALLPGRRPRRGHPARLLRRVPQVREAMPDDDRPVRDAARPERRSG